MTSWLSLRPLLLLGLAGLLAGSGLAGDRHPPAARAAGRAVEVLPMQPLGAEEGLALRFESGARLELRRLRKGGFQGLIPSSHRHQPFEVIRIPGDVPATGARGQGIPPRVAGDLTEPLWIFPSAWQDRPAPPGVPLRTGLHQDLWLTGSSRLPGPRALRIHLPRAYLDRPAQRFPVIFVLDAQNSFDASTSFGGVEWSLDEVAARLEATGAPPAILVGVDNGGGRRLSEYTFVADPEHGGGAAAEHLAFLLDEVEPFVSARFRTLPGRRSLIGSSLGGLFALWAALARPEAFESVAALSPSLWWANEAVLSLAPAAGPRPRIWMDMGTQEGERSPEQLEAMRQRLGTLGWQEGRDLQVRLVEAGRHHESAWADRAPAVLRFLIGE